MKRIPRSYGRSYNATPARARRMAEGLSVAATKKAQAAYSTPPWSPTYFSDSFNDSVLDPGWTVVKGTWSETTILDIVSLGTAGSLLAAIRRNDFIDKTDVHIEGTILQNPLARTMTLFARGTFGGTNGLSGYGVWWRLSGTLLILERFDDGVNTNIGTFVLGTPVIGKKIGLKCIGTTISVLVDDVEVLSVSDATYASGTIGIGSDNAGAFEYAPVRWADLVPPPK